MNISSPSTSNDDRTYLGREYFSRYAQLANSPSYVGVPPLKDPLPILSADGSLEAIQVDVRQAVRQAGVCLVRVRGMDFQTCLRQQESIFGPSVPDSVGAPFSRIAVAAGRKYYASSSVGQPMHSDDAHLASSPRLISLYCAEQALHGGVTTLASIGNHLDNIRAEIPPACFSQDAITIRGSAGLLTRPLIISDIPSRCPLPSILMEASGSHPVMAFYQELMAWCHVPEHQTRLKLAPGDLLFLDNHRVLHGRTPFPEAEPRTLLRVSFGDRSI